MESYEYIGLIAFFLVLYLIIFKVLRHARTKDLHISYVPHPDTEDADWAWCECHGCGHHFTVHPCGEENMHYDRTKGLIPECPQCGLRANGVYREASCTYIEDDEDACSQCNGKGLPDTECPGCGKVFDVYEHTLNTMEPGHMDDYPSDTSTDCPCGGQEGCPECGGSGVIG